MTKVVINTGSGFDLTYKAVMRYAELKGLKLTPWLYNYASGIYTKFNIDTDKELESCIYWFINGNCNDSAFFSIYTIKRTDPALIQVVEELKDSEHLDLKIVEVPDDVKWIIEGDEMGPECVREVSRCWS